MLLGLALLYVGAVLFLNGIWVMGYIEDREISVINVFVGTLTLLVSLFLAFGPGADADSIQAAAFTLLFTFTYYWVAWNRWNGADGRGLGWFCFFVGITVIPITFNTFANASGGGHLARHLLGVVGRSVAPVLGASRAQEADRQGNGGHLRRPGRLHGVDPRVSPADRSHRLTGAIGGLA